VHAGAFGGFFLAASMSGGRRRGRMTRELPSEPYVRSPGGVRVTVVRGWFIHLAATLAGLTVACPIATLLALSGRVASDSFWPNLT